MKGKKQKYFDTRKSEVEELRNWLQDRNIQRNKEKYRTVVDKVIAFMTLGIDVSILFKDMIMASATSSDLVQKKLVYLYICTHAESNSELALLTVNTLQKDAADENAMVRGLALRSMLSLRIPSLVEYMKTPLMNGLVDRSAYVRKTAVLGSLKLFYMSPEVIQELEIIPKLYSMIRDHDGQVCFNSVLALNELEASTGGIKLKKDLVGYLLDRLHNLSDWSQCMLMEILSSYQPEEQEDIFDYMNIMDDRLNHSNKAVVMSATKLFLTYAGSVEHIAKEVYSRLRGPLLTLMSVRSTEMIFNGLHHILKIVQVNPSLFSKDYNSFFLRQNEPMYVKEKKLEVLTYIVTDKNMEAIIEELKVYVNDPDVAIATRAIDCIGKTAVTHRAAVPICLRTLIGLISLEVDYLTSNVMEQLSKLLLTCGDTYHAIIPHIEGCFDLVTDHPKGKAAMIWILGQYGEHIPCSPYLLEEIIDNVRAEQSAHVKSQLLTATMKLYFKRSPECQQMLVRLLKVIIEEEENMDVRDRALFYFRLLNYDLQVARDIIMTDHINTDIPSEITKKPTQLNSKEFNTLSTIYGMPPEQFISPCIPYLQEGTPHASISTTTSQADRTGERQSRSSVENASSGRTEKEVVSQSVPVSQPNVAVADLLGELSLLEEDSPASSSITLVSSFKISPPEYEKAWMDIKQEVSFARQLTIVPRKDELEVVLTSHHIFTMASSPPENPIVKFFYYCQEETSKEVILIELNIYKEMEKIDGIIKCRSPNTLTMFAEFFQNLFVGKWIAIS